ncbi:hypothetical protein A2973_00245 [Candidatus Gottesmanbacteria bacterium RIFCSPLOWO2_01_FULL_49_10]|uniref:Phosphoribosyltransferase domain-containing protein n=1 Tax=Candidatus Gottesmanbacteria bacterium RIFCSPLOWO2_01_FULL_49_10 TaxID=1798396 RepID=A0A1F6AZ21_9BACT|nr:MAG: hypothetical protein A2973_00245 [Candidatus Gottesmanbacteria bacterium RIFCSPLOWO2_01_FULL_49_10]
MADQYLLVSWRNYHTLSQKLAAGILSAKNPPDIIVAISRGGLTLGHVLSDHLRIPVSTIAIQSYRDIQAQGEVVLTEKLKTPVHGKHVLLTDDVADSGKTLQRADGYLHRFRPKEISTVTMFLKPTSAVRPDYFVRQTTKWIIFPYESTEMILLITQKMTREGKTKRDIQLLLERVGFTDEQIAFVRKHYL